jgi:cation transport ATPase
VATFAAWTLAGDVEEAVVRTVTVLVIACPHALGLAIPLVVSISTSLAARTGILVRDRAALERMRTIEAVLFDKTGTLTTGQHAVAGIAGVGLDADEVLRLAGTDVAIESADVILASNDPRAVVSLIRLSAASYRKMIQNLAWAAGYNVVAIPLAAGAFAWAGITLPPAVGAVLMSASTIVVALNAQLLRRLDLRRRVRNAA